MLHYIALYGLSFVAAAAAAAALTFTTSLNEPSDSSAVFAVATEHETVSKEFQTARSYVVLFDIFL